MAATDTQSALLRQRAFNEAGEIEAVAQQHARRYAVVPVLSDEPVGPDRLLELLDSNHPGGRENPPAEAG
jgi:arsenite-transporting ATPase